MTIPLSVICQQYYNNVDSEDIRQLRKRVFPAPLRLAGWGITAHRTTQKKRRI